jgi:hypothetical protein
MTNMARSVTLHPSVRAKSARCSGHRPGENRFMTWTRFVRLAMVLAILMVLTGTVLILISGDWAAAAPGFLVILICAFVLLNPPRPRP